MKYKLEFSTQYKQFYLCDKESFKRTESSEFWTIDAHNDRLAIGEGILGIGTQCYGPVKGEMDILDRINITFDSTLFDHIVEGGIEIKSGILEVLDCPNSNVELTILLKPGSYCVRVYSSNLESVDGDAGNDYYKIEVWPEQQASMERNVLKRFVSK